MMARVEKGVEGVRLKSPEFLKEKVVKSESERCHRK